MLASYFRLAFRLYKAQRLFFLINLLGLITGVTAFMLILIYVNHEFSYDTFHQNADRTFRVYSKPQKQGTGNSAAVTPAPLAGFLSNRYHNVANTVRIVKADRSILSFNGQYFYEDRLILADPSFLQVFDFPLLAGDPETALRDLNSIIITQSMAEKYFGDANPLGKVIGIDYNEKADLTVTGVIHDVPHNSHFHFDFLLPIGLTDLIIQKGFLEDIRNTVVYTYVYLNEGQGEGELLPGLDEASREYLYDPFQDRVYAVQPIKSIHLHSDHFGEFENNSSIEFIQILTTIAFAILLMAMFNFINLSTALYQKRLPKIGMLKTIGSSQSQLIQMFCMESLLMVLLAIGLSTMIIAILLPYFGMLVDRNLAFPIKDAWFIPGTLSLVALLAILAASYPSLFISGQRPQTLLRGQSRKGGITLKNTLVICQFAVSVILLVATIAMRQQMDYIQNRDLGFSREALLVLPVADKSDRLHTERIKDELLRQSPVLAASASSDLPGTMKWVTSIYYNGLAANQTNPRMAFLYVDQDFLPTFGIELVEGRNFSAARNIDEPREFIINEAAAKSLGWKNPVSMQFATRMDGMGTVIGVMKDFHFKSVHSKIEPLFLTRSNTLSYVFLRIKPGDFQETLGVVEKAWVKVFPETPFDYFFYDTFFEQLYSAEKQFETLAFISAVVSILITCFGLFGLTAYSTQERKKEVAIRKVFGASVSDILLMLSSSFFKIFCVSMLIAVPASLLIVDRWLGRFEYRIEVKWWLFLASGMILVIISLLVISQQAISAARTNPVKGISHQ